MRKHPLVESVQTQNKFLSAGDELPHRALKTSINSPGFLLRSSEDKLSLFNLSL